MATYVPPGGYAVPRGLAVPISRRIRHIAVIPNTPTIGPAQAPPLIGEKIKPYGAVKVFYDRIMNRKKKLVKKWGLTLRQLRLDKDIFNKYMSDWVYYDMRTRMPKGWKKHLPMMYGFTSMRGGKSGEILIKVRHCILQKEVVNGFLYVKTVARYAVVDRAYDRLTGRMREGMDWPGVLQEIRDDMRTGKVKYKTESFVIDMETFECHKVLWLKKEANVLKKLLTVTRQPDIFVGEESTPVVERKPLEQPQS